MNVCNIFRDGRLLFAGSGRAGRVSLQKDSQKVNSGGALALGEKMDAGDYVLQIVVSDAAKSDKPVTASQWVQFEVTD